MSELFNKLTLFGMSIGVVAVLGILVFVVQRYLLAAYANNPSQQHYRQLITIGIWLFALILAVLIMPVGDEMRGQLLGFLGILLSATIALSSTTIVGNAMAGLMVRSLRSFRVGDHIRVGEHYGRISNMDLLHVEIQTEDRDLTTLPNLYMVANPVTVLRESGTLLHVEVSLGYDVPRQNVEAALIDAAERTGLDTPFVQIRHLGDFSVSYRISGLLTDISKLIATRRTLRAEEAARDLPELMLFDKAEKAASREILLASLAKVDQIIAEDGSSQALERRREIIHDLIAELDQEVETED